MQYTYEYLAHSCFRHFENKNFSIFFSLCCGCGLWKFLQRWCVIVLVRIFSFIKECKTWKWLNDDKHVLTMFYYIHFHLLRLNCFILECRLLDNIYSLSEQQKRQERAKINSKITFFNLDREIRISNIMKWEISLPGAGF